MKTFLAHVAAGLAAVGLSAPALANISLSLETSPQTIHPGEPASLNLVISGLGNLSTPSLGAFSVDLTYDPSILSAVSATFGNHLDLGILGSSRFSTLGGGSIHLDEVSFESATDLNDAQPDSFTLGTLNFIGLAGGTSGIGFSVVSLSDEQGQSLPDFSTSRGLIQVTGAAGVPDAGPTALLLAFGFMSISALGNRFNNRCRRPRSCSC